MSLIDTLPQVVVVLFSTLIVNIQSCENDRSNRSHRELDGLNNDPIVFSRFSTVKRDVIKIGFTLIQAGSFAFLFGWKFDKEHDKNSVLSAGLLAVCWVIVDLHLIFVFEFINIKNLFAFFFFFFLCGCINLLPLANSKYVLRRVVHRVSNGYHQFNYFNIVDIYRIYYTKRAKNSLQWKTYICR